MAELDRQGADTTLDLAAAAEGFGERAPALQSEEVERGLLAAQIDRYRSIVQRVHEGLFAGKMSAIGARLFLGRLAEIAETEIGQERTERFFGREPSRPTLEEFQYLISYLEEREFNAGIWRVTELGPWSSYQASDGDITGVIKLNRVRNSQMSGDTITIPIIEGDRPATLPAHRDSVGVRSWRILSDTSGSIHVEGRGEHVFGVLWVSNNDNRSDVRYLPMIDGEIWSRIDGREIIDCEGVADVTKAGWTGLVKFNNDDRMLPVVHGRVLEEIGGRRISKTLRVAPTSTGQFSGLVILEEETRPRLVVDGRILESDNPSETWTVGESRSLLDFHYGTFSSRIEAVDQSGTDFHTAIYLAGQPVRALDGLAIRDIAHPQISQGLVSGRVTVEDYRVLPLIDGHIMTHFEDRPILQAEQIEYIDNKLNGVLTFSDTGEKWIVLDGERVSEIDGHLIDVDDGTVCHNIGGTVNGWVRFVDERQGELRGPYHPVVLGRVVV